MTKLHPELYESEMTAPFRSASPMTDPSRVSEELLSIANTAYFQCRGNDVEKLRAAIDAVSDRLKAEGLREAARNETHPDTIREIRAAWKLYKAHNNHTMAEPAFFAGYAYALRWQRGEVCLARADAMEKGEA